MPPRRLSLGAPDEATLIAEAAAIVTAGGVVAYPTDTFYGLATDARQAGAVARLFSVKGRSGDVAIPLIAADLDQAEMVGELGPLAHDLACRFWPGPLTLVVTARPVLPATLLAGGRTVAVRVPDHAVARQLAATVGFPVTSTSANRSGEPPPTTADDVVRTLGDSIDLVLDGGVCAGGRPSTIVDTTGEVPTLVREGAVPWERIVQSTGG